MKINKPIQFILKKIKEVQKSEFGEPFFIGIDATYSATNLMNNKEWVELRIERNGFKKMFGLPVCLLSCVPEKIRIFTKSEVKLILRSIRPQRKNWIIKL